MNVLIDLRWMRPGLAGGIENLARAFIGELLSFDRHHRYTALVPAELTHEFDTRHRENFRITPYDTPLAYWRRLRTRSAAPSCGEAPDVVLSLSGYIVPDVFRFRNVLVFTDLQHEYHPEFFTPPVLQERQRVFSTSVGAAHRIIAISEFTRGTILDRYPVDPLRVSTAHIAADPCFQPERWRTDDLGRVLGKYGLSGETYLLYPANTWPHKNHVGALRALALLRDAHGLAPLLVLTGAAREGQDALLDARTDLRLERQVRMLGYCPTEDLPALHRGAAALFFPSLFEGFGMPLVEAMWCECPVVCSNVTSLPELAGDAAITVDPRSPAAMAGALARILTDPALRSDLVVRGRRRAPAFSWRRFTTHVLRTLHEMVEAEEARRP